MKKFFFYIILFFSTSTAYSSEITIIFSANINAALHECQCGPVNYGGLDRYKSFVDSVKLKHPETILVDGGDIFNSYPFRMLNEKILGIISILNPDIIVPGKNIYFEEQDIKNDFFKMFSSRMVLSNSARNLPSLKVIQTTSAQINFYGIAEPDIFHEKLSDEIDHNFDISGFIKKLDHSKLNVLIYYGKLSTLEGNRALSANFPLILLAYDQTKQIKKFGKTVIVGGYEEAKEIGLIKISRQNDEWQFNAEYIPMDQTIAKNPEIVEISDNFNQELKSIRSRK